MKRFLRELFNWFDDPLGVLALAFAAILVISLSGCAQAPLRSVSGPPVTAPIGFQQYCMEHPDNKECGGTR